MNILIYLMGNAQCNETDVDLSDCDEKSRNEYIAVATPEQEEVQFQRDSEAWDDFHLCAEDNRPFNEHDLTLMTAKLYRKIGEDLIAKRAIDDFLAGDYWKFVDNCLANMRSMTILNQQRIREVLILLTPGLVSTRYKARAVKAIRRDPRDVRAADIRHLPFCLQMFFHAAVRNGQLGIYSLADMCINAFFAPCLKWKETCEDNRFTKYEVEEITYGSCCFKDWPEIDYYSEDIWPNWRIPRT
jgi:hypothetical protein